MSGESGLELNVFKILYNLVGSMVFFHGTWQHPSDSR